MEKLAERIAKVPAGPKVAVVLAALAVVTLLNLFVVGIPYGKSVSDIQNQQRRTEIDFEVLKKEYIEKKSIANDLNRFRREREILEQRLAEALSELPEQKNISELLQSFQDRAQKSGLEIVSVEPKDIVPSGFYAKIPIDMQVEGNYHEIATFLDALGQLRRIVNVSDISLDRPQSKEGKVVLSSKFTATTFMFLEQKGGKPAAKGAQ